MDTVKPAELETSSPVAADGNSASQSASCPANFREVDAMAQELIGYIADKWTLIVLEELHDHGVMRFNELRKCVPGISQKMLTQTLRQMERNGLVTRKVYPVIPPRVEYQNTDLGRSLGGAVCGLWTWVADHSETLLAARSQFELSASKPAQDKTSSGISSE